MDETGQGARDGGNGTAGDDLRNSHIALGAERIGLIGLYAPVLTLIVFALLIVAAAFGIRRIQIDDSLSQLFRADNAEFRQYEQISKAFPSSEYDVLVVIEGKFLLERDSVDKLRALVTDLQLVEGARGVISLFSARQPAENGGLPAPIFPDDLPEGPAFKALIDQVKANALIRGRLLSEQGDLALVVLSLEPGVVDSRELDPTIDAIRKTMDDDLAGAGLTAQLSGVPVMQIEIRKALERDRIVYNALGLLAGCAVAILFFRRVSFMIVAAAPPLIAIVLSLGALGWLGFKLNMFLNVMTPLILVISFSDSMQLTFAARDRMIAGADRKAAFRDALRVVGPACVLTHVAAGLSLLGLLFSSSDLIRAFGQAGFLSIMIALATVLTLAPLLGALLAPRQGELGRQLAATPGSPWRGRDAGVRVLRRFCGLVAGRMMRRPGVYAGLGLIVVLGLGIVYSGLQPRYRLSDQTPDREHAVEASQRLDAKLNGANPIDLFIGFPAGRGLFAPETLDVIAEAHRAMEQQPGVANVWSLETLRRWLAEQLKKPDVATLQQYVDILPPFLVRRFVAKDRDSALISGRVPDKDAGHILTIVEQLNARLDALRARHPGYTIETTGLSVIAARNSAGMINKLNNGLTFEFAFIAAFIGLAFRSLPVALSCLPPGVFPVFAAGSLLRLLGDGLQFASVIALVVSFGLGLSATIHFLNRMWREDRPGADPAIAVARSTVLIGPALIVTAFVLGCGLEALAFSNLPLLRLFGWLSAFAMLAALVADLLILRPTIAFLMRLERRTPPSAMAFSAGAISPEPTFDGDRHARI
jgi:predicted RND superfamily exporter protein